MWDRIIPAVCLIYTPNPWEPFTARVEWARKGGVPLYEFECSACGRREAHPASIKSPPPLGSSRDCSHCQGRSTSVRVASAPVINFEAMRAADKYPYVSRQWSNQDLGGGCREDADGHPLVESRQHEREIEARTGLVRD